MIFFLLLIFCSWLSLSLIKELFLLEFISLNTKRAVEIGMAVYFLGVFFFLKQLFLLILPCIFTLCIVFFLKQQEEKQLFNQLCSLLIPLESAMKSGMSFLNAWDKILQDISSNKQRDKLQGFTEVLKFRDSFSFPENKKTERFINELLSIKQSFQPLKRIHHLQRKIRVEMVFRIKSQRALAQIRVQSFILCLFYTGLLINTFVVYKQRNLSLILSSLILFMIGLIWILKSGRRMKWSV